MTRAPSTRTEPVADAYADFGRFECYEEVDPLKFLVDFYRYGAFWLPRIGRTRETILFFGLPVATILVLLFAGVALGVLALCVWFSWSWFVRANVEGWVEEHNARLAEARRRADETRDERRSGAR